MTNGLSLHLCLNLCLQARVPTQWVLHSSPCKPGLAWAQSAPQSAEGQRLQEGLCLTLEAILPKAGMLLAAVTMQDTGSGIKTLDQLKTQ